MNYIFPRCQQSCPLAHRRLLLLLLCRIAHGILEIQHAIQKHLSASTPRQEEEEAEESRRGAAGIRGDKEALEKTGNLKDSESLEANLFVPQGIQICRCNSCNKNYTSFQKILFIK